MYLASCIIKHTRLFNVIKIINYINLSRENKVYLDLLIIVNLGMDYFLLYMVGRLTHRKPAPFKLLLGALGGVLPAVCLSMFPVSNTLWIDVYKRQQIHRRR